MKRFFNWLRNRCKPTQSVPRVKDPNRKIKKVALVVGHHAQAAGARGVMGIQEYFYFRSVFERLERKLTPKVKMFLRDGRTITQTINAAANWGADVIIEGHFDAFNGSARGATVFIAAGTQSPLMESFLSEWTTYANTANRGVRAIPTSQNGGTSANAIHRNGCDGGLVEFFFGDNSGDYKNQELVYDFLHQWIEKITQE
jgi:N-acetylmuramoyl-L-alanine amidase